MVMSLKNKDAHTHTQIHLTKPTQTDCTAVAGSECGETIAMVMMLFVTNMHSLKRSENNQTDGLLTVGAG